MTMQAKVSHMKTGPQISFAAAFQVKKINNDGNAKYKATPEKMRSRGCFSGERVFGWELEHFPN